MIKNLSIIFPIYNEENRLINTFADIEKFNKKKIFKKIEYIFVDDGSLDKSSKKIQDFIKFSKSKKITYQIINLKKNYGKGYALKKGVQKSSLDWILTIDADISVSLIELIKWIKKKLINQKEKNCVYFGSRNLPSSKIKYKFYRKFLGFLFNFLIKTLFKTNINDSQCGFKLYKKETAKLLFGNLKTERFSHDVELLALAKKFKIKIVEKPVTWVLKSNSKLNILIDPIIMFFEVIRIKFFN